MNINRDIANRALEAAGQERLNDQDIEKESARWRLIKDNYLSVILTTLSKTTWTSRLKRIKLTESDSENLTAYGHKYLLPVDCAKPEALNENAEYITEGNFLYTDIAEAVLQYVSNEKKAEPEPEEPAEDTEEISEELTDESEELPETPAEEEPEEDYPEYGDIDFDPALKEYIELQLAAKLALKITGDQGTFNLLYSQAMIIENNARKATLEHAHSKEQGEEWWGDRIGLSVEGK